VNYVKHRGDLRSFLRTALKTLVLAVHPPLPR
jgi:hypothetical protein